MIWSISRGKMLDYFEIFWTSFNYLDSKFWIILKYFEFKTILNSQGWDGWGEGGWLGDGWSSCFWIPSQGGHPCQALRTGLYLRIYRFFLDFLLEFGFGSELKSNFVLIFDWNRMLREALSLTVTTCSITRLKTGKRFQISKAVY